VIVFWDESGASLLPVVRRSWAPRGHTPIIRHHFNWKRCSMAAALCYGSQGGGAAVAFHHQHGAYDTDTLIGALGELRAFLGGQQATLVWDGLPAHRSLAMRAWLGRLTTPMSTSGGALKGWRCLSTYASGFPTQPCSMPLLRWHFVKRNHPHGVLVKAVAPPLRINHNPSALEYSGEDRALTIKRVAGPKLLNVARNVGTDALAGVLGDLGFEFVPLTLVLGALAPGRLWFDELVSNLVL
jgi:hypothetical protein